MAPAEVQSQPAVLSAVPPFCSFIVQARRRYVPARGVICSVMLHAAIIGLAFVPSGFFIAPDEPVPQYRVIPLRLQLPSRVYLAPEPRPLPKHTEVAGLRPATEPPAPAAPAPPKPVVQARRFEYQLPELPRAPRPEMMVLQSAPQLPRQSAPPPLPALMAWSGVPLPARPPAKPLVLPPAQKRVVSIPLLDAPPALAASAMIGTGRMRFQNAVSVLRPALPAPPAGATPLRGTPKAFKFEMSERGSAAGPQANVIALSSAPPPLKPVIDLGGGSWIGRIAVPAAGPPAPVAVAGSAAADGAGIASAKGTLGIHEGAHAGIAGKAAGPGNGTAVAKAVSAGTADGSVAGNGGGAGVPVPTGNYDAVVVHAAAPPELTEGAGLLSGRPIYSVYLAVGRAKDKAWILQYCIPSNGDDPPPNGNVVDMRDTGVIQPPYPYGFTLPSYERTPSPEYVVFHGFITAAGRMRELRLIADSPDEIGSRLRGTIAEWRFRPAKRDGVPVDVEVLLAIPGRTR